MSKKRMTPEEFAKLDPTSPGFDKAEEEWLLALHDDWLQLKESHAAECKKRADALAKMKPEDPGYAAAEEELLRFQQAIHVKATEHDKATKKLYEEAPAAMYAHEKAAQEKPGQFNRLDKEDREPEPQ